MLPVNSLGKVALRGYSQRRQDNVPLSGEVRDVLGDNRPACGPGGCRNLSVISAAESYVGDVNRVVTVLIVEQHRCGSVPRCSSDALQLTR
jgi:hypothetical protein